MSQENVELVLKGLEYWNRGDLDAFVGLWDDDAVLRAAEGWPEGGRPRGSDLRNLAAAGGFRRAARKQR
jgi:hypothetical protein